MTPRRLLSLLCSLMIAWAAGCRKPAGDGVAKSSAQAPAPGPAVGVAGEIAPGPAKPEKAAQTAEPKEAVKARRPLGEETAAGGTAPAAPCGEAAVESAKTPGPALSAEDPICEAGTAGKVAPAPSIRH